MTIQEYQKQTGVTNLYPKTTTGWIQEITPFILGLTSESGEIAGKIKKMIRADKNISKKDIALEVGDCLWYISELCKKIDYTMEEVMELNIKKLQDRRENNTIRGDGDER